MRSDWPLVGRQEELALVEGGLSESRSTGVVVAGAAGVGKTRLAREALRFAERKARPTRWAVATRSAAPVPFGALAPLLPDQIGPEDPQIRLGRTNLLRQAARAITTTSEGLVLGVDDAHLLDDLSAALVHQIAIEGKAVVVLSVRTDQPAPDAVAALWKEDLVERIELGPLSRAENTELMEAVLGSQVARDTLHRLWEATRGNPLLLRELVLGGLETGILVEDHGVWRWRGNVRPIPRLEEVVEARLRDLEVPEREGVEYLAVADSLGVSVLESLLGLGAVEELETRGLLSVGSDRRRTGVRLFHPLYGEVLRASMPDARARALERRLADALEETGVRRRDDLLRLAWWRLESGGRVRPQMLVTAARRSMTLQDFPLAERLAGASAAAGGGFPASYALAEALLGQGRTEEAHRLLERLEAEAPDDPSRARVAIARASNLFWRLGRRSEAEAVLARVERAVSDPVLRDEAAATRGSILVFGGRTQEGVDLLLRVYRRPGAPDRSRVQAAQTLGWGLSVVGRPEEAWALSKEVLEATMRSEDLWMMPMWIRTTIHAADLFAGRLAEAEKGLKSLHRETVEAPGDWQRGMVGFGVGSTARIRGRAATAARWLRESAALLREIDLFHNLHVTLAELAHALALLGDLPAAEAALSEAERHQPPGVRMGEPYMGLGRVWTVAARGEVSTARRLALDVAASARAMGVLTFEAMALHDAVRLGELEIAPSRLEELGRRVQGNLVPAFASHATALVSGDAEGLEKASSSFERMGAFLDAAESAAQASRLHRDAGRKASAWAATARARSFLDLCEGARTPALGDLEPLPLTPREREVATLASQGLSNQEIAERLFVSVRTVDNHLHRAYEKLGVAGRRELAPILDPTGPS